MKRLTVLPIILIGLILATNTISPMIEVLVQSTDTNRELLSGEKKDSSAEENLPKLHAAAKSGDWAECKKVIEETEEFVLERLIGLRQACKEGDYDKQSHLTQECWSCVSNGKAMNQIVQRHASKSDMSEKGFKEVFKERDEIIRLIVNDTDEDGKTPLHHAAENNHDDVIEELKEMGAQINAKDNMGRIPLHYAAWNGHDYVIEKLIEMRSQVNTKDHDNCRPLHYAAMEGHAAVCQLLLEHRDRVGDHLGSRKDESGMTPLHYAAQKGHTEACRILLENDGNVYTQDNFDGVALHCASENGHLETCKVLLEKSNEQVFRKDLSDNTPLHCAARNGHTEVCKLLSDKGFRGFRSGHVEYLADHRNISGRTPLECAAKNGHLETCRVLMKQGIAVPSKFKVKIRYSRSALHYAAFTSNLEFFKQLVYSVALVGAPEDWTNDELASHCREYVKAMEAGTAEDFDRETRNKLQKYFKEKTMQIGALIERMQNAVPYDIKPKQELIAFEEQVRTSLNKLYKHLGIKKRKQKKRPSNKQRQ